MENVWRDVRFGLRQLMRDRAFTAVVLLTLSVCIGANVAIFSVIDAVVLRPLPYADADRLVTIYNSYPGAGMERAPNAGIDYFLRRERVPALAAVAVYQESGHTVGEAGSTERVETMRVSASFFPLLGVEPALGRTFTEEENTPGRAQEVVLTHGFWQERFGGAKDAVGRDLRVDGQPYEIIGVLPESLRMVVQPGARFFVPIAFTPRERTIDSWHNSEYQMVARLAPGATLEQARDQIATLNASLASESTIPNARQLLEDTRFHTVVVGAQDDLLRDVRALLYLLWAGAGFVLLIACLNVANLTLARSHVRLAELATRLALGAPRVRLARQMLTEAIVTALLGGAIGMGVGALGLRAFTSLDLEDFPRAAEVTMDGRIVAFALVLAFGAAALFGTIPVVHVLRADLNRVFREEGRSRTAGRTTMLLRSGLATVQIAVAFVLLTGAGLMLRSFRAAAAVDPGFAPQGILTASLSLPLARYDADARLRFADDLLRETRRLPGVKAASVASQIPFSGDFSASVIFPEGWTPQAGESILSPFQSTVGPGYFEAMGIKLLEGRGFEESDALEQPRVIVIDEWLARRFWPDRSPVGERMIHGSPPGAKDIEPSDYFTVIGVVQTVKQTTLTSLDHVGAYYFTYRQLPMSRPWLVARVDVDRGGVTPAALRDVLRRLDPELPLYDARTMEDRLANSLAPRRAAMTLLGAFAGVALFLATVGIYGVLAYAVTQRSREMGIRMAIGSTPDAIFRLVVGQGLVVTIAGLAAGGIASLALVRLIRAQLFGVMPGDPLVLGAVAAALAAVATLACAIPARRATRIDPAAALHG